MGNKIFVVTGATSGIGKALIEELAKTEETVVMVARDAERGTAILNEITLATQNPNLDLQLCDLSVLSSVRNLAQILNTKYKKINVLINNASVYKRRRVATVEGFEAMFATNHLGPFLLTNLLLELLQAGVQEDASARVLNITAPSTTRLDFNDLQSEKKFNSLTAFGATKMANLLFTFALARRLGNTGITVNAIHPGLVRSRLMKESVPFLRLFLWLLSSTPEKIIEGIEQPAIAPAYEQMSGKFLHRGKEIEAPAYAHDHEAQKQLWDASERLTSAS